MQELSTLPYALADRLIEDCFTVIAKFVLWIQPAMPSICAVLAWSLVVAIALSFITTIRRGIANLQKMHKVPCSRCAFSSSDYRLKCSVRPSAAFSEEAIGCYDFEAIDATQIAL